MALKKSKFIILLLLLLFICSGCSNEKIESKKMNILHYNQKVDFVINQYSKNIDIAKSVEGIVIDGIFGNSEGINDIPSTSNSEINAILKIVNKNIVKVLEVEVEKEKNIQIMIAEREDSDTEIDEDSIRKDILEMLKEGLVCYYFVDSSDGVLEQSFILNNTNGNHGILSLFWLEGQCYKATYRVTGGMS